jgi:hypothetical protein
VKRWGGKDEDYIAIHEWLDDSKIGSVHLELTRVWG